MLSVGRQINIQSKELLCRKCSWQGTGAELRTGLIRITGAVLYLYAYSCPGCGSFDVAVKGKSLAFRAPTRSSTREIRRLNADRDATQLPRASLTTNRSWK